MSRKKKRPSEPSRFQPILRSVATLVLGTIMGLLIPVYFVKLLPGPRVDASIQQLNIKAGNAAGCTAYIVLVGSSKPLEYLSFAVQFPRNNPITKLAPANNFYFQPLSTRQLTSLHTGEMRTAIVFSKRTPNLTIPICTYGEQGLG